ncbi:plasminogen-like [Glandiceps talaboti]
MRHCTRIVNILVRGFQVMHVVIAILTLATAVLGQGDSGCGNDKFYFGFDGTFTSMNFDPNNTVRYDSNAFCEWVLETSAAFAQAIQLEFDYFSVENAVNCVYDSVIAYDGQSSNDPVLRVMCGHSVPNPTVSSHTIMRVEFTTDSSVEYFGFSAFWHARDQPVECELEVAFRCGDDVNGFCIPIDERCDGVQDCPAGEDEDDCPENSVECGRPQIEPCYDCSSGIDMVGGNEAIPGSWPWQASVLRSFEHVCGATILSNKWLITAANCVFLYQNNPQGFDIITGTYDQTIEDPFQVSNDVTHIYIHPNYSPGRDEWNFAMIKVKGSVHLDDDWHLDICLPGQDDIFPEGTEAMITGWGFKADSTLSDVLLQANITVNDDEYCNDPSRHNGAVTESLMCAGTPTDDDACTADDGGPMVWYRPVQDEQDPNPDDERWYLIGVIGDRTTFERVCADPDLPGLYGKVSSVVTWIEYIMINM